jgi:hypothetical protein
VIGAFRFCCEKKLKIKCHLRVIRKSIMYIIYIFNLWATGLFYWQICFLVLFSYLILLIWGLSSLYSMCYTLNGITWIWFNFRGQPGTVDITSVNGLYNAETSLTLDLEEIATLTTFECVLRIPEANYTNKRSTVYSPGKWYQSFI